MRRQLREEGESLPLVQAETVVSASLQLWSRLRDDVVLDMTRLRNRLHALLLLCDPEYKHVIRSLRSRIGIQAARAYTAPGTGQLDRVREQAVRQVAEQITLLMDQERELRTNIEAHTGLLSEAAWKTVSASTGSPESRCLRPKAPLQAS